MSHRNSFRTTRSLFFALVILLFGGLIIACGGEDDDPSAGPREYESTELGEILPADESHFDVDWAPETIVADEADVWNDLEDLQPYDGVFRVASGSSLLAGVEEGSIVVWPQVGIFEILSLDDQGDIVEVETPWPRFGAAMDRADISFGHALESGAPGRVVGVRAAADESEIQQGVRVQPLSAEAGPVEYSDEGLQYSGSLVQ